MSAPMEKETMLNTLEMDREVIRCKTCDWSNTVREPATADVAYVHCPSGWII